MQKGRGTDPPSRTWTVEEITLLKELEDKYKDHKYPNVEISKVLTSKTIEQIKNKRKNMKINNEDSSTQGVTQETEGGCDRLNSGNAPG
jgi:hypothetical protein